MIMVLVCLPSDALSQHLPSYLGFSYLRRGVSLHGCSLPWRRVIFSWPPLLNLNVEYLFSALLAWQQPLLGGGVAPLSCRPCPRVCGSSSPPSFCAVCRSHHIGAQYATGDQWRTNSRKNEEMEPKQKQHSCGYDW